eukprot:CAMPEP_0184395506 /NCGR_PEP_ID=MMETSP0007-20130409/44571_1 /TAXON_ID=97485 /ORGANISM="Prymnesium parvum, Strain Texoma1" /LENGTH=56 /DNA_ID=CAMNT_0026747707 /DNA_START=88 /DNA_END=255 /DNA_ORIENTATION=+
MRTNLAGSLEPQSGNQSRGARIQSSALTAKQLATSKLEAPWANQAPTGHVARSTSE